MARQVRSRSCRVEKDKDSLYIFSHRLTDINPGALRAENVAAVASTQVGRLTRQGNLKQKQKRKQAPTNPPQSLAKKTTTWIDCVEQCQADHEVLRLRGMSWIDIAEECQAEAEARRLSGMTWLDILEQCQREFREREFRGSPAADELHTAPIAPLPLVPLVSPQSFADSVNSNDDEPCQTTSGWLSLLQQCQAQNECERIGSATWLELVQEIYNKYQE